MRVIIMYDVSSDAARRKLFNYLESWGGWQQYSVFELEISESELLKIEDRLEELITDVEGSIQIIHICASCKEKRKEMGDVSGEDIDNVI